MCGFYAEYIFYGDPCLKIKKQKTSRQPPRGLSISRGLFSFYLLLKDLSRCGNGHYLPWNHLTAVLQRCDRRVLDSAAAWDFHADYGNALDIIVCKDGGQLFRVIAFVKLRTSDDGDTVLNEIVVETGIGVSGTVRSDEQVRSIEIRCVDRNQLDLYRPLLEL